jgi:p-methyltransferase
MSQLDCIIVGYNEIPFNKYVELLGNYSQDSEAYRDLKFSFVELDERPLNYVELLNHVLQSANGDTVFPPGEEPFKSGEIPNLAACYLSNFLRKRGLKTKIVNLFQNEKERFKRLLALDPVCVAITTTFYVLNFPVNEMVQFIREHNSRVKIVVGGPLVSNHLRNFTQESEIKASLADMGADYYVVDAQGEATLAHLVQTLKAGDDPGTVPNLIYFHDGQLLRSSVVPESNSMDEVDINWSEFGREEDLGATVQMRTARSCAFKCAFCNYPTRAGKLSTASLETVERELRSVHSLGNVKNVVFIDDTFNVPLPRFKDMCRMMIDKNFGFNWFSYFRCSNSDEEAIELMAKSGCKGVFLGIESGSPTILKNMNKAASVERYAEGIKMLRAHGITTFGSFIVGFPGETDETVEETISFIRENKPDFYRAQMWYCEPGTPIFREKDKYKIAGDGFVWQHASMTSLEAMDHIERMFLQVKESLWLPQWSFDFWFIPYFMGKGLSIENFKQFVSYAGKLLAMDIAAVSTDEKKRMQRNYVKQMTNMVKTWPVRQLSMSVTV